jgi:uncharacterized tellurite resistance protein B-like protein
MVVGVAGGFGLFGAALGGLIGFLFDEFRARRSRSGRIDRFYATGIAEDIDAGSVRLAVITGISCALLEEAADKSGAVALALLERQLADTFELEAVERESVDQFVDRYQACREVSIESIAGAFCEVTKDADREALIRLLYLVAAREGQIDSGQDAFIRRIADLLRIEPYRFGAIRRSSVPTNDEAYRILGVGPEAPTTEVKRVYRLLAAQFHPDAGVELAGEQRRQSEEAFIRIKDAYALIISERSAQSRIDDPQMDS